MLLKTCFFVLFCSPILKKGYLRVTTLLQSHNDALYLLVVFNCIYISWFYNKFCYVMESFLFFSEMGFSKFLKCMKIILRRKRR